MRNIIKKEYCADCEMPIEDCVCDSEETCDRENCCPRCAVLWSVVDELVEAECADEMFEVLKDFVNFCEEEAFKEGYKSCAINQIGVLENVIEKIDDEE